MHETTDQARKTYEQTLRTGQRLQEEAGQWWTRMLTQMPTATDWQKQMTTFSSMASRAMPFVQKRMEDTLDFIEKNSRTSADLMRKAVDAVQTPGLAECQTKWMDFWASSLRAVQSNVEAATEIGTKSIDSWIELVRKNTEASRAQMPKAA